MGVHFQYMLCDNMIVEFPISKELDRRNKDGNIHSVVLKE
jgi:hypothetical protein